MNYRPRIADAELLHRLQVAGAVLIEGPKACGKTETAMRAAASHVLLDVDEETRLAAAVAPDLVLSGETPRLIDEWQLEPRIWNHVRRTVDRRGLSGQFILTGSAVPADDLVRHTGAGRISRIRMRPMSLYETGKSTGAISLAGLFDGQGGDCAEVRTKIEDLADWIIGGGWPALIDRPDSASRTYVRDYIEEVRRVDIHRVDSVHRDPVRVGRVIRSFARHVGTYAAISTIATDAAGADLSLSAPTAAEYLRSLERLMIVEDQPAWLASPIPIHHEIREQAALC